MRALVVGILLVVATAIPATAQILPEDTTTTEPDETTTTTSLLQTTTTTEAEETTTTTVADTSTTTTVAGTSTTAPPDDEPRETTTTERGFRPPEGQASTTSVAVAATPDPGTGALPFFVVLSLGGFGVAAIIVGAQWWSTRPRR